MKRRSSIEKRENRKGGVVIVISDKHKHKERETCMVVNVEDNIIEVVKSKKGKTAGTKYRVKAENLYKALPDMDNLVAHKDEEEKAEKIITALQMHADLVRWIEEDLPSSEPPMRVQQGAGGDAQPNSGLQGRFIPLAAPSNTPPERPALDERRQEQEAPHPPRTERQTRTEPQVS